MKIPTCIFCCCFQAKREVHWRTIDVNKLFNIAFDHDTFNMEASKEKKKVTFAKAHSNKNKVKNGENEDFIPIPKTNSCKTIWHHLCISLESIFFHFSLDWPISTRTRLFLPFFALPCAHQSNSITENNAILGKGRFGIVYGLDKPSEDSHCKKCFIANDVGNVAIKKLKKSLVVNEQAVIQIIEEIRIHSVCSGLPFVLPFLKAWQNERNLYVAVPLCNHGSLADLFKARKAAFSSQSVLIAANQIYTG